MLFILSAGQKNFYPRPPRGGRQEACRIGMDAFKFLSTPSARRATQEPLQPPECNSISIHALREEGDSWSLMPSSESFNFYPRPPRGGRRSWVEAGQPQGSISIHALREEGDPHIKGDKIWTRKFLSTPSARRATAKTETKSLFSNKLYNILHEFRRALIYNGSKSYPNHAK